MTWSTIQPQLALTALGLAAAGSTWAADADAGELDSSQVGILVTIDPIGCARGCVGELPATGGDLPTLALCVAAALLLLGVLALARARSCARLPALAGAPRPDASMRLRTDSVAENGSRYHDVSADHQLAQPGQRPTNP
jgi:hypothetical protein